MTIQAQDLQEAVQLLMQGRPKPAPVSETPAPAPIAKMLNDGKEEARGVSLLVSMSYKSLSGNVKDRDILIRRVLQNKGDFYIDGVAMDIRAPRLIKASHVSEIRDISSGRPYTDVYAFLRDRLGLALKTESNNPVGGNDNVVGHFGKAIERVGTEATVLMYLVSIDGNRDKTERKKVFDYLKSRTQDLVYSDEELNDYLISLAPDEACFKMALSQALSKDAATVQGLVEAILNVIMADGHIDDKERAFLVRVMDLLEQAGFEISLPI